MQYFKITLRYSTRPCNFLLQKEPRSMLLSNIDWLKLIQHDLIPIYQQLMCHALNRLPLPLNKTNIYSEY